jgi:hypothetical protein
VTIRDVFCTIYDRLGIDITSSGVPDMLTAPTSSTKATSPSASWSEDTILGR